MSKELERRIRDLEHKLSLLEQVEKGGVKKKEYDCLSEPAEQCLVVDGFNSAIDLYNAHLVKKLEGIEEIIEQVLLNKIKIITDTEQTYSGYPAKLMRDLAQAITTYLTKNDS